MNVPKLRFKEFDGEWEERKLIDNAEKVLDYRGKTPTKFGMNWGNEGYLVLSALNVKDGYIDKSIDAKYGNQELLERWMGDYRLVEGDVLFTTEAPLGNVAQVPDNNGYILNQRAVAFKTSNRTDNNFFARLLRSPRVQNILYANSSGGTAKGIGMKEFAKLTSYVPKIDEQKKIGLLFEKLDKKIQLQQQKIDLLQEQKKGFLQKMFPKVGETQPEIRFEGFTGGWEQCKLEEVANIFDGTHQTPKYKSTGVKFVSVENIATLETNKFISQEAYDKEYSKKQAKKGDVLMTRIGDIGTAKVIETEESLAYYVTLALLKPNKVDSDFLAWLISSPEVQRNIWKRTLHIAFPKKINLGEINKSEIMVPSNKEQTKIGVFFKKLNDTIALHQQKLDLYKEQKKGLMQQMFI